MIWIWCGDPAHADLDEIPDLSWLDHPDWTVTGGHLHMKADYRLIDNLLDLTHVSYITRTPLPAIPKRRLFP